MAQMGLADTRTGEVLGGRYVLGGLLGKGGHGEVYRARDIIDQTDVAIKCLAPHLAADNDYRLRLVREARAMSALKGLSTLQIMGVVGADDGTPCLVMELLEGVDLFDYLQERVASNNLFSTDELLKLFYPIIQTLDAAHALGIIHRDIKPSNIFLQGGKLDDPRIMDFGLAKTSDLASITADQMLAGSPSYIAPEIWLKGAKGADRRSDVYSLACVMYQTLTGSVPIYKENLAEMLVAVTTDPRPSIFAVRPDLPEAIDAWAEQALAIHADARFQTVVAMFRALRSILQV
jgi:serine/threonine-protein kinase